MFLSCAVSCIGLLVAVPSDRNIFKVLIFNRAVISAIKLGSETGLYRSIEADDKRIFTVESAFAAISCVVICYAYIFEVKAVKKGLINTLTRASGLSKSEMRFFDSMRAIQELKRSGKSTI